MVVVVARCYCEAEQQEPLDALKTIWSIKKQTKNVLLRVSSSSAIYNDNHNEQPGKFYSANVFQNPTAVNKWGGFIKTIILTVTACQLFQGQ